MGSCPRVGWGGEAGIRHGWGVLGVALRGREFPLLKSVTFAPPISVLNRRPVSGRGTLETKRNVDVPDAGDVCWRSVAGG